MGLTDYITHSLVKTTLSSIIIWFVLILVVQIPTEKIPMVLLVVLFANVLASLIASVLLMGHRGY